MTVKHLEESYQCYKQTMRGSMSEAIEKIAYENNVKIVEMLGYLWIRKEGIHTIEKNY